MKAIILSAGQGSRLLPLTEETPKCLLELGALTLLEWQIQNLVHSGVDEVVVVTGFAADKVEETLEAVARPELSVRTRFNPFYSVGDNLSTCWLVRDEMRQDFLLINGDTVFEAPIPDRLLRRATRPVTVAINRKPTYDSDDMKVRLNGDDLVEIGKTIDAKKINGESIGMMLFQGEGPRLFSDTLDRIMRTPAGLRSWYTSVVDGLAADGRVGWVNIEGLDWAEVDYHADLERAQKIVSTWPLLTPEQLVGLRG